MVRIRQHGENNKNSQKIIYPIDIPIEIVNKELIFFIVSRIHIRSESESPGNWNNNFNKR